MTRKLRQSRGIVIKARCALSGFNFQSLQRLPPISPSWPEHKDCSLMNAIIFHHCPLNIFLLLQWISVSWSSKCPNNLLYQACSFITIFQHLTLLSSHPPAYISFPINAPYILPPVNIYPRIMIVSPEAIPVFYHRTENGSSGRECTKSRCQEVQAKAGMGVLRSLPGTARCWHT